MEKIDAADLESWLAEEDQNCSSRYSVRLVRNGMRAVATSELLEEDEPRLEKEQTTITSNSSQITRKFSDSHRRAYVMAIWKRCMVLIFGKRAFYLRLPSQEEASPIPCTQEDDLHVDLFTDHDKPHMPGIRPQALKPQTLQPRVELLLGVKPSGQAEWFVAMGSGASRPQGEKYQASAEASSEEAKDRNSPDRPLPPQPTAQTAGESAATSASARPPLSEAERSEVLSALDRARATAGLPRRVWSV
eukprot:s5719_g2.t1